MTKIFRALRGALVLGALLPASAFAGDRIGVLECHLSGNGPSLLVENQSVDCVFANDRVNRRDHYAGKLTKIGANIGVNGKGDLLWGVVAATSKIGPGALAGDYAGPEASAKVGWTSSSTAGTRAIRADVGTDGILSNGASRMERDVGRTEVSARA